MTSRVFAAVLTVIAGTSLSSCKTFPKGDMAPAALMSADDTSILAVKTAAADVLGRDSVELGASDFANSPAVSVLPNRANSPKGAPFNQQDFALPTMLLLMTDGSNCFLVEESTRKLAHVKGVECRSIA